ncbi:MAG TPA: LysM peptidoglycan-binding domain-containing protein [Candidatus Ozemobacteraceae bacterium]|nr:LysM peptidoglycan-binding domain-containing protein [Candidatus Ozemobacteraceae bacterium]
MRQTIRNLGLLAGLLSLCAPLAAEPVVGGYVLERLPGGKQAVVDGRNIVLAHVFNQDPGALKAGRYDVGVEVQGSKGVKTYVMKPTGDIAGGVLRTFRLKVPLNAGGKPELVRAFARIDGRKIWSEPFAGSRQAAVKSSDGVVTTLYTEVAPEPGSDAPPREIPFENEVVRPAAPKTAAASTQKKPATGAAAAVPTAKPGKTAGVAPVPAKSGIAPVAPAVPAAVSAKPSTDVVAKNPSPAPAAKPRVINPNEFKTLHTIDEELVIYVVKAGDTLQSVAERYYGDAGHDRTIADLNFIEARAQVKPGEEIIVDVKPLSGLKQNTAQKEPKKDSKNEPKKETSVRPSEKASEAIAAGDASACVQRYTIQNGDTLAIIAKRFYGKASKAGIIIKANPGLNPKNLKIGTEVVIPAEKGDKA